MQDLFQTPEKMPTPLADIMKKWEPEMVDGISYQQIEQMLAECEAIGFTFEYGLDACPYDLRPIKQTNKTK